jgi:predicted RNA-binding Zn-ribbon protein involved in translation (DUF1610 family)
MTTQLLQSKPQLTDLRFREAGEDFMHDNELWAFLYVLAGEEAVQELSPVYKPQIGVSYKVDSVDVPADRIRRLAEKGLLDVTGAVSFGSCPHCGSMNLMTAMRCPNCRKQTLSKSELIVHYGCGHLASINEILSPDSNEYTCPKCRKQMKRVGIDYGRPGLGFKCLSCHAVSQYPLLMLVCDHGHELKVDEQELIVYSVYRLGRALQTMPRIVSYLNAIKEELTRREISCVVLAQSRGATGEIHIAPLLVFGIPPIIADFIIDESGWEFQVLQSIKKSADLSANALLIVKNELFENVKNMVNPDRIKVVPFEDESTIPENATRALVEMRSAPLGAMSDQKNMLRARTTIVS